MAVSNSCPTIVPLASVAVLWLPPESRPNSQSSASEDLQRLPSSYLKVSSVFCRAASNGCDTPFAFRCQRSSKAATSENSPGLASFKNQHTFNYVHPAVTFRQRAYVPSKSFRSIGLSPRLISSSIQTRRLNVVVSLPFYEMLSEKRCCEMQQGRRACHGSCWPGYYGWLSGVQFQQVCIRNRRPAPERWERIRQV